MASGQTGAPALTPAGIQRLIVQLDKDLQQVTASAASAALKQKAKNLVGGIKGVLHSALGMDPGHSGGWVLFLAPQFQQLTATLQQALGPDPNETGACFYSNPDGCIQSTRAQCDELGGSFQVGASCP